MGNGSRGLVATVNLFVLVCLVFGGCGETATRPDAPEPPAPSTSRGATTTAAESTMTAETTAGASGLSVGDPAGLPGDPVPVEFLPEGFVLPAEATVVGGNGEYTADTGQFYLELDAPLQEVQGFFEEQYSANGWAEISAETFEEDGVAGFDLLYGRDNSATNAGFTGEERGGRTLVQVYTTTRRREDGSVAREARGRGG